MKDTIQAKGKFKIEQYRDGKLVNSCEFPNGITNQGKNRLLDSMFHSAATIATWYCSLINNAGGPVLAAADTYQNINQGPNAWTEFTDYTVSAASVRATWGVGAASGQVSTSASQMILDITGDGEIYGGFIVGGIADANQPGDHAADGVLWATAARLVGGTPTPLAVSNGDQLKITYSVNA
jgi:hypothetical protein